MIVEVDEIAQKSLEIQTEFSAPCKLCKTILYDKGDFVYPTVGEMQTRYFYCDDCSEREDQEISFEKLYIVKSILIEVEEVS